jgi:hypothetical protein
LAGEYGLTSLDEFVAEYQANPEFSNQLKTTTVNGRNPWMQLIRALANFVRTKMGIATVPETSTFDAVDKLVQEIIAPTYDGRAATKIYMALKTPEGSKKLLNSMAAPNTIEINNKKDFYNYVQEGKAYMGSKVPDDARKVWLNLQPVNILGALAESRIPGATGLNTLVNNMSAKLHGLNESLNPIVDDLKAYKKNSPKNYATLQYLLPNSSAERIDPREKTFDDAYGRDKSDTDLVKLAKKEYADLRKKYLSMDKTGQDLFNVVVFNFEDKYKAAMDQIDANLEATIKDKNQRQRAKDQLAKLFNDARGVIKPFVPLTRDGRYRLQFNALDPKTNRPEQFVERYKTKAQREEAVKALEEYHKKSGAKFKTEVTRGTDSDVLNYNNAPTGSFIREVLITLQAANTNQDTVDKIIAIALDSMPERSFMQSMRVRKDVRGFQGDITPTGDSGRTRFFGLLKDDFDLASMVQNKGRDYNRQIVQMEFGGKLEKFNREVLEVHKSERIDPTTLIYKTRLEAIVNFAKSPNIPRWSQSLNAAGYAWTMGWNLSSAGITSLDVLMSTLPRNGSKYGDKATAKAMGMAASILARSPKFKMVEVMQADGTKGLRKVNVGKAGFSIWNYDYTDPNLDPKVKDIEVLAVVANDNAQINQSLNQEELDMNNAKDALEKINSWTSFLFHHAERYNREVALISTYMLELGRLRANNNGKALSSSQKQDAAKMAVNEVEFTLGATASAGRPVASQSGLGNVLMLFKRFAISKYHMMTTMTNDAFEAGGDAQTKENRRIARGALGRFLVINGTLAGVAGLPLMGALGFLYDTFVADEDEDDFDAVLRKTVGEGFYKGIINAALGVDVASRISMNSLLYRPPIITKDQPLFYTLIEQLGGPVIGITLSVNRGMNLIGEGEWARGTQAILPSAVRNVLKAGQQLATGEVTTRRGNAVVEDIGIGQILGQFGGFANADVIRTYEINKNEQRKKLYLGKERTRLLRQANIAAANNDRKAYRDAIKDIKAYNRGLSRAARTKHIILPDTIKKSRKAFDTRTSKMIGGIEYTPMMRSSLKEYDQGIQLFK